jgi:hypothetical protein
VLTRKHQVRLVYPIPQEKWVVREDISGQVLSRRRSPKRMGVLYIFEELVSIPTLINHTNFEVEALLTKEEQVMQHDGKGSWRRQGWSIVDRRLLEVVDRHLFSTPLDILRLIPEDMVDAFTSSDLAKRLGITSRLAQKALYCMRKMGMLKVEGKRGRSRLYRRTGL